LILKKKMTIKILHNQSLLDVSIYLFGTAIGVMSLAIANDISLTDDLEVGTILNVPENTDFGQRLISEYFQNRNLKPATAINELEIIVPVDFGIGEMVIEESFIIR